MDKRTWENRKGRENSEAGIDLNRTIGIELQEKIFSI